MSLQEKDRLVRSCIVQNILFFGCVFRTCKTNTCVTLSQPLNHSNIWLLTVKPFEFSEKEKNISLLTFHTVHSCSLKLRITYDLNRWTKLAYCIVTNQNHSTLRTVKHNLKCLR